MTTEAQIEIQILFGYCKSQLHSSLAPFLDPSFKKFFFPSDCVKQLMNAKVLEARNIRKGKNLEFVSENIQKRRLTTLILVDFAKLCMYIGIPRATTKKTVQSNTPKSTVNKPRRNP